MTLKNKIISVYKKGTRVFVRMPHAKNDLIVQEKAVPQPFIYMLREHGNVTIPFLWSIPKDISVFIPDSFIDDNKEAKGSPHDIYTLSVIKDCIKRFKGITTKKIILKKMLEGEIPATNCIESILRLQRHSSENTKHDFKKNIRKLFSSHLAFIRQDVTGEMFGNDNPDMVHDPINDGTPDSRRGNRDNDGFYVVSPSFLGVPTSASSYTFSS